MSSCVQLMCVAEGVKLRVRIVSYTDERGKIFYGVYNNKYNCRFPRHLRCEGRLFTVPASNVKLLGGGDKEYYYSISTKGVTETLTALTTWHESECVVCMAEKTQVVFVPCGHACACTACAQLLQICCLCRQRISCTEAI
jgi:Zinc finger, C3HC4 type (RING finger)